MRRKYDLFGMLSIILQDLALEIQQKCGKIFDNFLDWFSL